MLTALEAFRAGFLLRCAEEGLSQPQIDARVEKSASFRKAAEGGVLQTLKDISLAGLGTSLAAGTALGGLGGAVYGLSTPDDFSAVKRPDYVDDVQRAELISAYRRNAADLRRQAVLTQRKAQRQSRFSRSPYGI